MTTHLTANQAVKAAGVTYRQLDYWTTNRYVRCHHANPGSGYGRKYTAQEVHILTLMAALVKQGMEPRTASRVARRIVRTGQARIGRHFVITEASA